MLGLSVFLAPELASRDPTLAERRRSAALREALADFDGGAWATTATGNAVDLI